MVNWCHCNYCSTAIDAAAGATPGIAATLGVECLAACLLVARIPKLNSQTHVMSFPGPGSKMVATPLFYMTIYGLPLSLPVFLCERQI